MLAWMDEEALRRTRETGEAWFWSRSRERAVEEGRDVGQHARRRGDARRLRRRRAAPPRASCRARLPHRLGVLLRAVALARIKERQAERPHGSYVVSLLDDPAQAARKVGEEGLEAALAGAGESDERLVEEIADLWFHSYVLLAARGLDVADVEEELRRRIRT